MKKLILIIAVIFLCMTSFAKGKAGLTGSYISSKLKLNEITTSPSAGFDVGFVYHQPLVLGFAIQPGLVYSLKKTDVPESGKASISYVEVPVQVQWGPDLILLRPYVLAEPFVGYAIAGKYQDFDVSKLKSRLEYGLGVGVGADIAKRIQLAVKYYWNFDNCGLNNYVESVKYNLKQNFNGLKISATILF